MRLIELLGPNRLGLNQQAGFVQAKLVNGIQKMLFFGKLKSKKGCVRHRHPIFHIFKAKRNGVREPKEDFMLSPRPF